ncbi:MAG: hypothetical protein NXH84_07085 [Rhodobacteraceae bacterium]|nr:hypothetical protein [Paracoccaceae bacterium]
MDNNEVSDVFVSALADPDILSARLNVLDTGAKILGELGSHAFVQGLLVSDKKISAFSILSRLAADITVGFATLMRSGNEYSAAALLRQLVEFEYLFFVAYQDKSELGKWLGADGDTLRKQFTPQKMRKKSNGIFSDQEYWMHCDMGGHPNPKARAFLAGESNNMMMAAFLLPDGVHHFRRLWTSFKLLYPVLLEDNKSQLEKLSLVTDAIETWKTKEHPLILSFDGMQHTRAKS